MRDLPCSAARCATTSRCSATAKNAGIDGMQLPSDRRTLECIILADFFFGSKYFPKKVVGTKGNVC